MLFFNKTYEVGGESLGHVHCSYTKLGEEFMFLFIIFPLHLKTNIKKVKGKWTFAPVFKDPSNDFSS